MSKGPITLLDTYNANFDELLSARERLKSRIDQITTANRLAGLPTPQPTLRDIQRTHMLFVTSVYIPHVSVSYEYIKCAKTGGDKLSLIEKSNSVVSFNMSTNKGDWVNDQVVRVVLQAVGDPNGTVKYRYCDLPGARLCEKIAFRVNNVNVSDYTDRDVLWLDFHLADDKFRGLTQMLGQEQLKSGSYYFKDYNITQQMVFTNGAQTFKPYQERLEMWIPLQFWYNTNVKTSLCNARMNTLQNTIDIKLADVTKLIEAVDANGVPLPNYVKQLGVESIELYTKNIYVNPEIHDIIAGQQDFALIRIKKRHEETIQNTQGSILLSQLKYPIEYLEFGFQPLANAQSFTDWHRYTKNNKTELPIPAIINNPLVSPVQQLVVRTAFFNNYTPVVSKIGFTAMGNTIYPMINEEFFNKHISFINPNISVPRDRGKYMATFSLLPGAHDLSGHFNNSVAREYYINYIMADSAPGSTLFYITATCLNILIYNGSGISLKYVT